MSAVTQWFDMDSMPVHVGFYQRMYDSKQLTDEPDYWDGKDWHHADQFIVLQRSFVKRLWRGLAVKP